MLKIRKGHLRIIFFLRSLFSVRNIYEIYTNLTVMTLLNLTHFLIITQVELCLKRYICNSKYICNSICTFENPRRKNFINPTCLKYCTIINWNKKCKIFIFTLLYHASERFHLFETPKRTVRIRTWCHFSLIPLGQQGLRLCFAELLTCTISIFLTTEIHKNYWKLTSSTIKLSY